MSSGQVDRIEVTGGIIKNDGAEVNFVIIGVDTAGHRVGATTDKAIFASSTYEKVRTGTCNEDVVEWSARQYVVSISAVEKYIARCGGSVNNVVPKAAKHNYFLRDSGSNIDVIIAVSSQVENLVGSSCGCLHGRIDDKGSR